MNYIKENLLEMKESFKNFKDNKINNIAILSSSLILLMSLIWGLISIILFYIKNGFHLKFSSTIFSIYYNDIMKYIFIFLCVLSVIMILILYFKESSKKSKILFFASIVGIFISIFLMILFSIKENKNLTLLFAFVFLIFCILPMIVIYKTNISQIKTLVINSIIYYLLVPIILLLLSNFIPLIIGIVVIGIMFSMLSFSSSSGSVEISNNNTSRNNPKKNIEKPQVKSNKKMIEVPSGMNLYREKGTFTPDYIVQDNGLASHKICTQEEFDKGKVVIVQNKAEIRYVGYRKK